MIKEIGRNAKTDWHEKIQLELDLADIQIIYDCIGAVPERYIKLKHKLSAFNNDIKGYYGVKLTDIYESLHVILSEHNGVTDDNMMINTGIDLELVGDEKNE